MINMVLPVLKYKDNSKNALIRPFSKRCDYPDLLEM